MNASISPQEQLADSLSRHQCDPVEESGQCDGEHKPAARFSAFYFQDFVQPWVPKQKKVAGQIVRGEWEMVEQPMNAPFTEKAKKSPAEMQAQRDRKNATYQRNAMRVNPYSEIGRTGTASNSETAPR